MLCMSSLLLAMGYGHAIDGLSVTTCRASSAVSCDVLIKVNDMFSLPFGAWRQPYWHVLICLVTFSTGLVTCYVLSSGVLNNLTGMFCFLFETL